MAQYFVREFGPLTFPMYWEQSYQSWDDLRVVAQPAAMLFGADGSFVKRWYGPIPEATVLELIGA